MFKSIEGFLHVTAGFTVVAAEYRFGNYVAFVMKEDIASQLMGTMGDFNADSEWELWGLGKSEWFPVGFGEGVDGALRELDLQLKSTEHDWAPMIPILEQLSFGQLPNYNVKCPIMTMKELRDFNHNWNHGHEQALLIGTGVLKKEAGDAAT
jgi:hypothetical protein